MAGYSFVPQQYYYTTPKVQHTNTSYAYNNYCASTTNSHVDVARYNDSMHIASTSRYSDGSNYAHHSFENYMQRPMSNNMHTLNFDAASNIQLTHFHTSATERVHMPMNRYQDQINKSSVNLYETPNANNFNIIQQGVSHVYSSASNSKYLTQSMPMNEKISHADFRYPANYFQPLYARVEDAYINSAPYTNINTHISAPDVSNTYSRN